MYTVYVYLILYVYCIYGKLKVYIIWLNIVKRCAVIFVEDLQSHDVKSQGKSTFAAL